MIKLVIPDHPLFIEAAFQYFSQLREGQAPPAVKECRATLQINDGPELPVPDATQPHFEMYVTPSPAKAQELTRLIPGCQALPPPPPLGAPDKFYPSAFDTLPDPEAAAAFGGPANTTHPHLYPPVAALTAEPMEQGIYNASEYDGRGFPWDARIHTESRVQLAKKPHGWKLIRGVNPALVAQVEAELQAAGRCREPMAIAKPNAPTPVAIPAAPVAAVGPPANFADLANRLTVNEKFPALPGILQTLGVESFQLLAQRPDLFATVAMMAGV